jgi:hypothetical protein
LYKKPSQSFHIKIHNPGEYSIFNNQNQKARVFDSLGIRRFVKEFHFKHASRFITGKTEQEVDSIYNSPYFYQIGVKLKNGFEQSITIHKMTQEEMGNKDKDPIFRTDYLYGVMDKKTLVLIQTHIFAPMFKELDDFKPRF